MTAPFLTSLRLGGFLSFAPGTPAIDLRPLNVIIGPNGSGKSNLIEGVELLKAAPSGFGAALRVGGGPEAWLWKGGLSPLAEIEIDLSRAQPPMSLRYRLVFAAAGANATIEAEELESLGAQGRPSVTFLRFAGAQVEIAAKSSGDPKDPYATQTFDRHYLNGVDPILAQRRDPLIFPDLAWLADRLSSIETFREWSFGRLAKNRQPQSADLPSDKLAPRALNLALVVQNLIHHGALPQLESQLRRFLSRFERLSVSVGGGGVALYLHEEGVAAPIPATRMSDGTLRFIALLATLMAPVPPPLVCIEEPELGLHPDAVAVVADLLVEASQRTQLIVTTHSDALVSALTEYAESVLVCEHLGGGSSVRRVESEKLKFWLEKYRLGEIWRIGKLGGNP